MQPYDFKKFWSKYRNVIFAGLFFLMLLNYCNRHTRNYMVPESVYGYSYDQAELKETTPYLNSYEEIMRQRYARPQKNPNGIFILLFLLIIGAGIVWLYRDPRWKRYWIRLLPGYVNLKVVIAKDKITGRKLLKISIRNKTTEGITFLPPIVVFRKWGKERRFRLKGSFQGDMFPLTLTPETSHRLVIDLEQFYEKLPDLKNATRVGAAIETTGGKVFKKFAWPLWLSFFLN
jgi:hypothetical protein